jgi:hypothetical protein
MLVVDSMHRMLRRKGEAACYLVTILTDGAHNCHEMIHNYIFKHTPQCSRKNQHNAQICTTALFHMLAPTCFGSSLSSSGSFCIRVS